MKIHCKLLYAAKVLIQILISSKMGSIPVLHEHFMSLPMAYRKM